MRNIAFIDTEVDVKSKKILDIGGITDKGLQFHSNSTAELLDFINRTYYVCGHNIINHDLPYIEKLVNQDASKIKTIDTLFLSPLLFPSKPYHALLKDDKLQTDELNNPLNDAIKAKDLFYDEVEAFREIDTDLKQIYFALLGDKKEFMGFFHFINYSSSDNNTISLIQKRFSDKICHNIQLDKLIIENSIELTYCLALINSNSRYSITPPWVVKNYPDVDFDKLCGGKNDGRLLEVMGEYNADGDWHSKKENGNPPYDPFSKVYIKIGEKLSSENFVKWRRENPGKDKEDYISERKRELEQKENLTNEERCELMKLREQETVNEAHADVIKSINEADSGNPDTRPDNPDGENGSHAQAYVRTVMDALHFNKYINMDDEASQSMIVQMGIHGAKPNDIRDCLAELSGFEGDKKMSNNNKAGDQ